MVDLGCGTTHELVDPVKPGPDWLVCCRACFAREDERDEAREALYREPASLGARDLEAVFARVLRAAPPAPAAAPPRAARRPLPAAWRPPATWSAQRRRAAARLLERGFTVDPDGRVRRCG